MNETPRVLRANRAQLELRPTDLESLLPEDHRARVVWEFVLGLDLSAFYAEIRSVEGHAGRPAIDAAILLSLWIYATSEGVGSARGLVRLCERHDAYRWICGGVEVSAHTLVLAPRLLRRLVAWGSSSRRATDGAPLPGHRARARHRGGRALLRRCWAARAAASRPGVTTSSARARSSRASTPEAAGDGYAAKPNPEPLYLAVADPRATFQACQAAGARLTAGAPPGVGPLGEIARRARESVFTGGARV